MAFGPLDVAPQVLNRVVVRRVGRKLMHTQPLGVGGDKALGLSSGMVGRPVLDDHNRVASPHPRRAVSVGAPPALPKVA